MDSIKHGRSCVSHLTSYIISLLYMFDLEILELFVLFHVRFYNIELSSDEQF